MRPLRPSTLRPSSVRSSPSLALLVPQQQRWFASSSQGDAYALLGVPRGATDRDYKVAYLKLAKTCAFFFALKD